MFCLSKMFPPSSFAFWTCTRSSSTVQLQPSRCKSLLPFGQDANENPPASELLPYAYLKQKRHFKANVYCLWTHFTALEHMGPTWISHYSCSYMHVAICCFWSPVDLYVNTNVSERQAASIIRAEIFDTSRHFDEATIFLRNLPNATGCYTSQNINIRNIPAVDTGTLTQLHN